MFEVFFYDDVIYRDDSYLSKKKKNLRWRLEVDVGDIFELDGWTMLSGKSPKLRGIHDTLPTAWGLGLFLLLSSDLDQAL